MEAWGSSVRSESSQLKAWTDDTGVQYATKLGYKVIGIDLGDAQLEEAKAGGAMHTFNPIKDKDYLEKIKELTGGGCHAAVNFTASKTSFDTIPDLLRIGGIMVVAGIPAQGKTLHPLSLLKSRDVSQKQFPGDTSHIS